MERFDKEPVMFGTPTPEGRKAGDCYLCQGEAGICDCQLGWTTNVGSTAGFRVEEGCEGQVVLAAHVDGETVSTSPILEVG